MIDFRQWATFAGGMMTCQLAFVSSVHAQERTSSSYDGMPEIVVTAQKREQAASDVGLSIVTVGEEALERRDITSAQDLVKIVPGLSVSGTGNGATVVYTLRGVGFNSANLGATSAVAVYVDEVPLAYPVMTQGIGLDLKRVEAYKGPQGTLFGQNSTGGAINYIANKPTETFEAGIEGGFGRFNRWNVEGYVSGPVSETLRVRVAARQEGGGAWQKSYTRNDKLGKRDQFVGRALLEWEPTESLTINAGLNGWKDASDSQANQLIEYDPLLPPGLPQVAAYPTAPSNPRAADWDPKLRFSGNNKKFQYDSWFVQPFLRLDADLSDTITLTSLSTYSRFETDSLIDVDGTSFEIGEIVQRGDIEEFNQELRLSGKSGPVNWVFGGNYQTNTINEEQDILIHDLSNVQNIGGSGFSAIISPITTKQKTDAFAVFGNVEVELSDQFNLVGGVRYTKTKIDFTGCNLDSGPPVPDEPTPGVTSSLRGFFNILYQTLTGNTDEPIGEGQCITLDNVPRDGNPPTFLPTDSAQKLSEDNVSWNLTANFKLDTDTLLYARIAKGYKSGSFPAVGASTSIQYLPARQESVLTYEAGFKASLADRRINIEGAGFYYDYNDKQLSNFVPDAVFGPLIAIVNIPKSRIYGAEISATIIPVDGLTLSGGVTYIDTKIKEFDGFDVNGAAADLSGEKFNLAPDWSGSLDAIYEFPVAENIDAYVGSSLTFRGKTSGVIGATSDFYDIDAYTLVDLQVGVKSNDGWRLQVWGKNITNKYYWSNVNRISDTIVRTAGMPATYGVTVGKKF